MAETERVNAEQRYRMIAEAAYFKAEQRGFTGGDPLTDWIEAEKEIDARLAGARREGLLDALESQLAAASERLQELRRRMPAMTAEVREEWDEELDKLANLRDQLGTKLEELRRQGEKATVRAKRQADKLRAELMDAIQRVASRR